MADDVIYDEAGDPLGVRRPNQRTDISPRVVYLTEKEAAEQRLESEDGSPVVVLREDSPIAQAVLKGRLSAAEGRDGFEVTAGDAMTVGDVLKASDGLS